MKNFRFSLYSPAGNVTLFIDDSLNNPDSYTCRQALLIVNAEQAGICNTLSNRLHMAGGEFCVNAARAFGCYLDQQTTKCDAEIREYKIHVSGCIKELTVLVSGAMPTWTSKSIIPFEDYDISRKEENKTIVHLPGISHLLIESAQFPKFSDVEKLAALERRKHALEEKPASGVVWWRKLSHEFEIFPFVHVPGSGTAMLENACGSASLALCAAMQINGAARVLQPGKEILEIETGMGHGMASVSGLVKFMGTGELWLEE